MKKTWDPLRLDVRAFARESATLTGTTPLVDMPRLAAEQNAPTEDRAAQVTWTLIGQIKDLRGGAHQTWLHVQAQARLGMVCQRCLEGMGQKLAVDRPFRFVSTEQAADAQDDASEEDLLVASTAFDAMTLIEDELILALPLVPRHDDCSPPA
jgi:uncharacterized protein